ncbi:ORF6N domain-containing protein [Butyricicoccus faecihominis]|uniref:ORF6N domain-containing protein n=1 Tax=Butyricicoccus faecihominis TaxID=1712515 RepID=UPI0024798304|nr:ORF6N domain-containing protein [Butyricicoccus faecihominis]MCQ5129108.1 ORF6N domain-containing protein [Butyricicoccus faecihominis]
MNTIKVNNYDLPVREFQGQRVTTFRDIDAVHNRPEGTARKRFNDNQKHFLEGTDYFVRNPDEAAREYGIIAPNGIKLITESGYLMLVKSFTDDLAWMVQRQLVNGYFRARVDEERKRVYPVKASSLGEAVNWAKLQHTVQKEQGSAAWKRAAAFERTAQQFGIDIIPDFVEPPKWEDQQLALTAAPTMLIGHVDTIAMGQQQVSQGKQE